MKKLLPIITILLFALATGCEDKEPMETDMSNAEEVTLTLYPDDDLTVTSGIVIWKPETNVKKSTYKEYYFDYDSFMDKIGKPDSISREMTLTLLIAKRGERTYIPEDPMVQAPIDGYLFIEYNAEIIEVK